MKFNLESSDVAIIIMGTFLFIASVIAVPVMISQAIESRLPEMREMKFTTIFEEYTEVK